MSLAPLKGLDTSVAFFLLLSSAAFTVYAYAHVLSLKNSSTISLGQIKEGASRFDVRSEGKCVGSIEVLQENEEALRLRGEGSLQVDWQGQVAPLIFMLETFFNPLGQLVRSGLEVRMGTAAFSISTADVHPIQASIKIQGPGPAIERTLELPGPIMLRKNDKLEFGIDYPAMGELVGQAPSDIRAEGLNLLIEPVSGPKPCNPDGAINLTSVAGKMLFLRNPSSIFGARP